MFRLNNNKSHVRSTAHEEVKGERNGPEAERGRTLLSLQPADGQKADAV